MVTWPITLYEPKGQGRDPIIFQAAVKLFDLYHGLTQLIDETYLIYTDFSLSYWDALDRLSVRLNIILLCSYFCY